MENSVRVGTLMVSEVIRRGKKNARVALNDGRVAKFPIDKAVVGQVLVEEDLVVKEAQGYRKEWFHIDLVHKARKHKVYATVRDMSAFKAEDEIAMIKAKIKFNQDVFGRVLSSEEVEDYAQEAFCHLWERGVLQSYNPDKVGAAKYSSYLGKTIRRFLIDCKKRASYRFNRKCKSLSQPVCGEDDPDAVLESFVADSHSLEDEVIAETLRQSFAEAVDLLDGEVETVCPVSYRQVFDSLLGLISRDSLVNEIGESALKIKENYLRNRLNQLYQEAV